MSAIKEHLLKKQEEAEDAQYVIVSRSEKIIDTGNDWDWSEYEIYATLESAQDRLKSVNGARVAKLTFIK